MTGYVTLNTGLIVFVSFLWPVVSQKGCGGTNDITWCPWVLQKEVLYIIKMFSQSWQNIFSELYYPFEHISRCKYPLVWTCLIWYLWQFNLWQKQKQKTKNKLNIFRASLSDKGLHKLNLKVHIYILIPALKNESRLLLSLKSHSISLCTDWYNGEHVT